MGREQRVPEGEHAAVDAMQPATSDAIANAARAEPELDELAQRDEPMLAVCERRDCSVTRGVLRIASRMRTFLA
jgi:hypothetical protein